MKSKNLDSTKRLIQIPDTPYVYIDKDTFAGSLEDIVKNLDAIKERIKECIENTKKSTNRPVTPFSDYAKIVIDWEYDYDGGSTPVLRCYRLETDQEIDARIAESKRRSIASIEAAKKSKEKQEANEKALFEKLKKKYGP